MAMRAAAVAAASASASRIATPSNPSLFSLPRLKSHYNLLTPPPNALLPLPIAKPAGFQWHIRAISEAAVEPASSKKEGEGQSPKDNWKIKMLYDGDCPLCMREVMGRIHAILSDGTVVTDVEAFRRLYEHVGLGWVYAITKYEPIAKIADSVYGVWAKYRLQITGRPPIEQILEARKKKGEECKDSNACKM